MDGSAGPALGRRERRRWGGGIHAWEDLAEGNRGQVPTLELGPGAEAGQHRRGGVGGLGVSWRTGCGRTRPQRVGEEGRWGREGGSPRVRSGWGPGFVVLLAAPWVRRGTGEGRLGGGGQKLEFMSAFGD